MKKRLFNLKSLAFFLGLSWLSVGAYAQTQLENPGFEAWENIGSDTEEPTEWNSNMTGTGFASSGGQTLFREATIIHSGTYSAKIKTTSFFGTTVNGQMTCGLTSAPSFSPSDGYNATVTGTPGNNTPMTTAPDSIVVWINYTAGNGTDKGRISAVLHGNYAQRDPFSNDANGSTNVAATAVQEFGSTGGWIRKVLPFDYATYSANNVTPAYILVTFTSSNIPGSGSTSSIMYVDDLELIYNPKVAIAPTANQNLLENQAGSLLTATETNGTATSRTWKYATTAGGPYTNTIAGQTGSTYTPQFLTAGTYYVVCESTFGTYVTTSNEVKVVVTALTNSIAPTADQMLVETQAGTQLTVTESATAASRVWKYSTTAGGPYTNTITGETATTYTPQFATTGTYYVVCESTLYGETKTSNEVKISVIPFAIFIAPNTAQNLIENQSGNTLTVTENATADSREWKFSTTSGSGYISFGTAQTGTTYTPQFATANTYYVVCESTYGGNAYPSNEVQINVTVAVSNVVSISPNSVQNLIETQVGTTITASETPAAADSREWKFSTTSGSGYTSFGTAQTGTTYSPQFANANTYYVVCVSDFAGDIQTSGEVQINVSAFSNSIAPTATQNLLETEVGTQLTVTETPVADSREWKYSTTSGSGYISFGTAQTGTTYTPQFATANTYYVVCESTIAGITKTSNEVEIIVSAFTNSIAPATTQNLYENQAGTLLTVTESATADSREWKYSTTAGGPYTNTITGETATTYTPLFATVGTYYVVCNSTLGGNTVTSNEVEINVTVAPTQTVTIAPTTTQNLLEAQAGTQLTVTETPAADSREWKFSTTSGSGYASFTTTQTGMTYTPQFATAGTYYVICEADYSGTMVNSNEVTVIVTVDHTGINENTSASFAVYSTENSLKVDLSNTEMKDATIEVLSIDGKVIAQQALTSNQMNTINVTVPTGVYFFAISNGSQFFQGKVFIK